MLGKIAAGSAGVTIFVGTAYVVGIMAAPAPNYKVSNEQRLSVYEEIAPDYERKTKRQEFYLGIGRMRRRLLLENANGRVLEVGAGTASNCGLYPPERCDEVIFSDRASSMVKIAADKVIGRVGYRPYRYPDLPEDSTAPVLLDKYTRQKQQKVSEIEAVAREKAKADRRRDPSAAPAASSSPPEPAAAAPEATTNHSLHRHDENGRCITEGSGDGIGSAARHLVSMTANLSAEQLAEVAARRLFMIARQRDRRAKEAAEPSRAQGTQPNPNSREQLAIAAEKQLYSVANYPAERLPFADNEFDTIVDMFGLCSFEDPVAALGEMSRVCKPNGRVLLLEHGRGSWERVNWYLDKWAPRHASSWGCWWNRDIRRMIRTAGLTVVKREEKHFGTSMMYVCAPYKTMREMEAAGRRN